MLEKGVSDHRHERVTMQALPGPALEVITTEFFFQLLIGLSQTHRALMVAARLDEPDGNHAHHQRQPKVHRFALPSAH